ncbi:MAG: GNAT family N-acetyltransferase [Chakrabartia sp.]
MFARTKRLVLRPGWTDDAPALAEAIGHEAVAKKLACLPWPYGPAEARAFLDRPYDPTAPQLLIFLRTAGKPRLIGGVGLNPAGAAHEIGYWIAPEYWGLGFATEAAGALVDMARLTLRHPRLVARHFVDNPASANVLRKLGFTRTGKVAPHPCAARGQDIMAVEYARDLMVDAEETDAPMRSAALLAA